MAEGAEAALRGEKLLIGHRVEGVREGEGRAARRRGGSTLHQTECPSHKEAEKGRREGKEERKRLGGK